jgi:hypothetical protein
MLVTQKLGQQFMRLKDARFGPYLPKTETNGQGIDEQAKHAVCSFPALHPPKQNRPEHWILLAGRTGKNQAPCNMAKARSTYPQGPRLSPQASG